MFSLLDVESHATTWTHFALFLRLILPPTHGKKQNRDNLDECLTFVHRSELARFFRFCTGVFIINAHPFVVLDT
jgi:hypothetical protein